MLRISNVVLMCLYNYELCGATETLPYTSPPPPVSQLSSTSLRVYCGTTQPFVTTKRVIAPAGKRCSSYITTAAYNTNNKISCNSVYMHIPSAVPPYLSECAYLPFSNVSFNGYKCKSTSIFYTDCPPPPPPPRPPPPSQPPPPPSPPSPPSPDGL